MHAPLEARPRARKNGETVGKPPTEDGAPGAAGEAVVELDRSVRCAACGRALARVKDRIEVNGTSAHVFVNPSAIEFTIACFRDAAGCAAWGETSTYWSW